MTFIRSLRTGLFSPRKAFPRGDDVVVHHPSTPEHTGKLPALFPVRVQPVPVTLHRHLQPRSRPCLQGFMPHRRFGARDSLPPSLTGPLSRTYGEQPSQSPAAIAGNPCDRQPDGRQARAPVRCHQGPANPSGRPGLLAEVGLPAVLHGGGGNARGNFQADPLPPLGLPCGLGGGRHRGSGVVGARPGFRLHRAKTSWRWRPCGLRRIRCATPFLCIPARPARDGQLLELYDARFPRRARCDGTVMGSGSIVSKTGRYKLFLLGGPVLMLGGLALLGTMGAHTPYASAAAGMFLVGLGIGVHDAKPRGHRAVAGRSAPTLAWPPAPPTTSA